MHNLNKLLRYAMAALLAAGGLSAAANENFEAAYETAEAQRKEAAAVGYEWRDTGKMLKQAKQAAAAGEMDTAMQLVAQAGEQAADAIAQQAREARLWSARVPR